MMRWNYETDLMLRLCLDDGWTYKRAARLIGCSQDQAMCRARRKGWHSGNRWCADADDMLRLGWRVISDAELAGVLKKSVGAIRNRASRIGLPK